jgi:hypothetical protein
MLAVVAYSEIKALFSFQSQQMQHIDWFSVKKENTNNKKIKK